ncbi:MAG: DUF4402 domain-containing protein [Rhodospirillales bacterium]
MPFPFLRPRTRCTIAPAASIKADRAERQPIPPHQCRDGACRAPTRSLVVRLCAAVVLAACLVSGLATGIGDAAATVTQVSEKKGLWYGDAAGDADLTGTVVIGLDKSKTVTGGVFDFGGNHQRGEFQLKGDKFGTYACTLPSSFQVTSGANSATVDTILTNPGLTGTLDKKGKRKIKIGATLNFTAGQPAGNYSGTLDMTCDGVMGSIEVTATILEPISISSSADLDFGTMLTTGTAGTVTVTPAGARSSVNVDLFGGIPSAASFDVTGEPGAAYAITLPSSATLTSGGNTMTVDTYTHDAGAAPTLPGGSDTFNVGATLNVGGAQAPGTYSGTFDVTVNYN